MTRLTDSANVTASQQPHVSYVLFGDFDFVSGHVRVSSWDRQYTFGGNTYLPFGTLVSVGDVTENSGIQSDQLQFTLSGVDNSLLTTVLAEKYHGRDATLYFGYLDSNYNLVTTPEILWEGIMDTMAIKTGANTSTILLTCENRLILWNKNCGWLYTDEHQRIRDSTDLFFNQSAALVNKTIHWGSQPLYPNTPTPFFIPPN
jgi:hypothetical protein